MFKLTNIIRTFTLSVALVAAYSCQMQHTPEGKIEIAEEALTTYLASAGETAVIKFNATADWTIRVPNTNHYSWASINPTSGVADPTKDEEIAITVLRNENHDARSFDFDLVCGSDVKSLKIVQKQKDALTVTNPSFEVGEEGDVIKIQVVANIDYIAEVEAAAQSWIQPVPKSKGLVETEVLFKVLPAEDFDNERTGHITIKSGEFQEVITVTQAKKTRVLEVSATELKIDKNGGEVTLDVNANFPYNVTIDENDWAVLKSDKDNKFVYTVSPNPDFGSRSVNINVTTDVEGFAHTVKLVQTGVADIKVLWTKKYADLGITLEAPILRVAEAGDALLVSTGKGVYALNRTTGEKIQDIQIPEGMVVQSLANDEAGNIIFAANAAFGAEMTVYTMKQLTDTPKVLLTYNHSAIWSNSMGNLRVRGDINAKAVITASVDVSQYWVAWQIEGGKVAEQIHGATPAGGSIWNPQAMCVAPMSSSLTDGILFMGYIAPYSLHYCADPKANKWVETFATGTDGNENYNCISVADFGGVRYAAYEQGAHFSWGSCPEVHLLDMTDPAKAKEAVFVTKEQIAGDAGFTGVGASSDVLLTVAPDGKVMNMYVTDGNYDVITCVTFTLP